MTRVLGIDFGGTKILAGVVDSASGEVLAQAKRRTHVERGGEGVLTQLSEAVQEALAGGTGQVSAAGIGVAGQVDVQNNELKRAPNLPETLLGSVIVDAVHRQASVPVRLNNDVAAAAAGEAAFGAGADYPDFVCIFVGTGIGGAIYRDGQPYLGATDSAGELGHMTIDFEGRICSCGGLGHLEAYASRMAIVRSILAAMRQGRQSSLQELVPNPDPDDAAVAPIRSKVLKEALDAGDDLVREKLDEGAHFLAAGISSIVNLYNPPLIVVGGGLVDAVDRFFDRAATQARQLSLSVPAQRVEIVKATLGDYSGVVGAAILAARQPAASGSATAIPWLNRP